jgi:hypothetical protein
VCRSEIYGELWSDSHLRKQLHNSMQPNFRLKATPKPKLRNGTDWTAVSTVSSAPRTIARQQAFQAATMCLAVILTVYTFIMGWLSSTSQSQLTFAGDSLSTMETTAWKIPRSKEESTSKKETFARMHRFGRHINWIES